MIDWNEVNSLQKKKLDLEIKYAELIKSEDYSEDAASALKSEILYLTKRIRRIVGSKEIERQNSAKNLESEQRRIASYQALKKRYVKIGRWPRAKARMLRVIDLSSKKEIEVYEQPAKTYVKVA